MSNGHRTRGRGEVNHTQAKAKKRFRDIVKRTHRHKQKIDLDVPVRREEDSWGR